MNFLTRVLARAYLAVRYRLVDRRYRRLVLENVQGVPFLVLPDVFNPVLFRTGPFLVEALLAQPRMGETCLDLGTGSGIGAVFAARQGYRVVGVDINPEAVRCARLNAVLNRVEDRVTIRLGDVFAPVAAERFDVVLFNPPFYRGQPRDALDHAWRGVDVFERFAVGLRAALTSTGYALIVLSTDGEGEALLTALRANGHAPHPIAQRDLWNEVLTVYKITT